jgi:hypothetical protein
MIVRAPSSGQPSPSIHEEDPSSLTLLGMTSPKEAVPQSARFITSAALIPPKPNELLTM